MNKKQLECLANYNKIDNEVNKEVNKNMTQTQVEAFGDVKVDIIDAIKKSQHKSMSLNMVQGILIDIAIQLHQDFDKETTLTDIYNFGKEVDNA